jgi:beta-lactamase class A
MSDSIRRSVLCVASVCCALVACEAAPGGPSGETPLRQSVESVIDGFDGEVAVYYRSLEAEGDSLVINGDVRMHAASTMKVPVMIRLFRDLDAGSDLLSDSLTVDVRFRSIVDGSEYVLDASRDSDTLLYRLAGRRISVRELVDRMVTMSSNLATNLLIDHAGAPRTTDLMRRLGADSIEVLRGVEDIAAYEAGLNNTTTARDLGAIFAALGDGSAASAASTEEMIRILEDQEFRAKIPAGLPAGVRVANKTGLISSASHDAALVLPDEGPAYVLVVLTRDFENAESVEPLAAEISRRVYRHHVGPRQADTASGDAEDHED